MAKSPSKSIRIPSPTPGVEVDASLAYSLLVINNDELLKSVPGVKNLVLEKLPTMDSCCLMRIIENLVTKVVLIASFPRILDNLEEFSLLVGRKAVKLFKQYGEASKQFLDHCKDADISSQSRSDSEDHTFGHKSVIWDDGFSLQTDFSYIRTKTEATRNLVVVLRNLLHELMLNPLVTSSLIKHKANWAIDWSASSRRLADLLTQLRELTQQALLTTPTAKARRDDLVQALRKRDAEQTAAIDKLTSRYEQLQQLQKDQIRKRLEQFQGIHEMMLQTRNKTSQELNKFKTTYENETKLAQQKHDETMQSLKAYEESVNDQLDDLTKSATKRLQKLKSEKWKIEDEIAGKIYKMDLELTQLQEEYDEIKKLDDEELEAMRVLRLKLEPIKAQADIVLETKRREAERKAAEMQHQQDMIRAATMIQSLWRSWKARKLLKAEWRRKKKNPRLY